MEETETLAKLLKAVHVLLGGDNNDGVGIASCNGQDAAAKFVAIPKSRNDHANIFGGKARWEARANWLVGPSGHYIDDGASVTPEPVLLWRMVSREVVSDRDGDAWANLPEADKQYQVLHLGVRRRRLEVDDTRYELQGKEKEKEKENGQ